MLNTELSQLPNDTARRMISTLTSSSGIMPDKTSTNIDIDAEANKWREEFGVEIAGYLDMWVRAAMPDYEYLKDRRLR